MNRIEDIEKRARSESMTKWIGVFEEEFDLDAEGSAPTERMNDLINQLHDLLDDGGSLKEIDRFVRKAIVSWYRIGARRGAAELVNLLYKDGVLDDKVYDLPDKIEWTKRLKYVRFDGEKSRIPAKRHTIEF